MSEEENLLYVSTIRQEVDFDSTTLQSHKNIGFALCTLMFNSDHLVHETLNTHLTSFNLSFLFVSFTSLF